MHVTIERIDVAGPDHRARRLVFSEGAEARTTAAAVVKALALEEGMTVPLDGLEADIAAEEAVQAKERAIRLVGYRERSPEELRTRLGQDGYPAAVVAPLVMRFEELALVDESRFAAMYARSRAAAGYGARRIRRELLERGISDCAADAAIAEIDEDELARAVAQLRNKRLDKPGDRDRLLRRLVSRGFDYSVARLALSKVAEVAEPDEPFIAE